MTERSLRTYSIQQWLPLTTEAAFAYFADETKLDGLTPPWFRIKVLGKSTDRLGPGTLLDYRMTLRGLPLRWRSRIEDWDPPHGFAYTQVKGPYLYWKHAHFFEPQKAGTLMTDTTFYRLRGGPLGRSLFQAWAGMEIRRIFEFRKNRIERLLGASPLL